MVAVTCDWAECGEELFYEGAVACGAEASVTAHRSGTCNTCDSDCNVHIMAVVLPNTFDVVRMAINEAPPLPPPPPDASVFTCREEQVPWCPAPPNPAADACWRGCTSDADCTLVEANGCGCEDGGQRVAIRNEQAAHWPGPWSPCSSDGGLANRCDDCTAGYAGARAACVGGLCTVACPSLGEPADGSTPSEGGQICRPASGTDYGNCEAELGAVFLGGRCLPVSGCSCAPDCDVFFLSVAECEAACRTCTKVEADLLAALATGKRCQFDADCTALPDTTYGPAVESGGCTTYLSRSSDLDHWSRLNAEWQGPCGGDVACSDGPAWEPICLNGQCEPWPSFGVCHEPGCGSPPAGTTMLPGPGCYSPCIEGDCPDALTCTSVWINPGLGTPELACGGATNLCQPR